jgi:hypothetical protein
MAHNYESFESIFETKLNTGDAVDAYYAGSLDYYTRHKRGQQLNPIYSTLTEFVCLFETPDREAAFCARVQKDFPLAHLFKNNQLYTFTYDTDLPNDVSLANVFRQRVSEYTDSHFTFVRTAVQNKLQRA